ncbi:MAG: phage portal protein [Actinobacteria bacterium]|nr:phage portal protein [Actinomycetota bacterium]
MSLRDRVAALVSAPGADEAAASVALAVKPAAVTAPGDELPGAAFFDFAGARAASLAADLCMSLPAVRAAVLAITGPISEWPLYLTTARGDRLPDTDPRGKWLADPEPGRTTGWLKARTLTDGIWLGRSIWQVKDRSLLGAVTRTERVHPNRWTITPDPRDPDLIASITIDGRTITDRSSLIVFDFTHLGGLNRIGWPMLSLYADIMAATANYARSPLPKEILRNTGADLEDDEVDDLLDAWVQARRASSVAYLNSVTEHTAVGWNAQELQLIEGRVQIATEVAQTFGLPAFAISAKTGDTQTYGNVTERRRDWKRAISPWSRVLTETLTRETAPGAAIVPRTLTVNADASDFTADSPSERMDTWEKGLRSGVLDMVDVKAAEPLARSAR